MSTLLYHPPDNPVEESPFDRAILELAIGQDVKIVSPYISLSYLERIIGVSQSWRLISDVLEWLSATPPRERDAVCSFLQHHEGLVHHYPAIHAKAVMSPAAAYTGSANLTDAGVLRRTEFGVVLREKAQIDEIHQWFAALWAQTSPPSLAGVRELITWLNQLSAPADDTLSVKGTYLESNARKVRARLVKVLGEHPVSIAARLAERHRAQIPSATAATSELSKKALQMRAPAKESQPFDLDAAVSSFIEKHAALGFSFSELHSALMELSGTIRVRETYFAVLNYCASRPQSLFSEDAVNRLVYRQGRFVQSSKVHLDEALAPFDVLLEWLFKCLSFSEQRPLPAATPTALAPRPPHAAYRLLVSELATGGFIHLEQGARLNERASWSPRLRLLTRAHQAWESSLAKHRVQMATALTAQAAASAAAPNLEVTSSPLEGVERSDLLPPAAGQGDGVAPLVERGNARERMLERLDILFEQLAQRYIQDGEVLETSLPALVECLSKASNLKDEEVEQALNGSSPYIQSPFMALPTSSLRKRVRLFPLLEGNTDLSRLLRTREAIATSAKLLELSRPQTAQAIPSNSKKFLPQKISAWERDKGLRQLKPAYDPPSNGAAKQSKTRGGLQAQDGKNDMKLSKPDVLSPVGMVMKAALSAAQRKQSDALFAQLLQLAITHGNPLPPNRLTGAVSDIQQQADTVLRKVNELCRQYPDTVRPVITLQRPSDRPSYIDVVLQVKHEDDLSFLPMTAKLLASPSLTMKRVRQTTEA
ncbi:phospholipase D-like domain-containing protein [Alicycliphilus denitrificans]|uniref:phospholipase D-like domain-containing protein n=1 Tax=Alicycliphilus denitrificans TaxID=179636 RepID=UPI0015FFB72F|nr:phospholipase D-like domain-containing protein [Alicycliphilus denitrificans]